MERTLGQRRSAMRQSLVVSILMVVGMNGGCVARTYWHGKLNYPPRPKEHPIDILLPGERTPYPCEILGTARIDGYYATGSEILIRGAQRQARKRGGDAIVLGEAFEYARASSHLYIPGSPGQSNAAAIAAPGAAAAAITYTAPTPPVVVPVTAMWPILHAVVLRYERPETQTEHPKRDP